MSQGHISKNESACLIVPLVGNSRETELMAALEFVVSHYLMPRADGEEYFEAERAARWLASKYAPKASP